MEFFFNGLTNRAEEFIGQVYNEWRGFLGGYIALRFSRKSPAMLGPQRFKITVIVEVTLIQGFRDTEKVRQQIKNRASEMGALPHWGQSDIEIAPVHHRLPDRIRAHALICFLALVLYRVMRMRLKARGHSASPRTALDLLARIQKHTAHAGNRTLHGVSRTTPEQLDLFEAMDLPKPA